MEVAVLALAGSATALATGLGAVPVFLLGDRAGRLRPFLWGTAVGLMGVASIVGLLLPALDEGGRSRSPPAWLPGCLPARLATPAGGPRRARGSAQRRRRSPLAARLRRAARAQPAGGLRHRDRLRFQTPRAWRCSSCSRSRLQNVPEGTSVAIPMQSAGFGRAQQFWAAVLTSAPQPVGAVAAYLAVEQIDGLLPFSFAFAAGAMLSLVAIELAPQAFARGGRMAATGGTLAGAAVMMLLALTLGVG